MKRVFDSFSFYSAVNYVENFVLIRLGSNCLAPVVILVAGVGFEPTGFELRDRN